METFILLKKGVEFENSLEVKKAFREEEKKDFDEKVVGYYYSDKKTLGNHITLKEAWETGQVHILNRENDKVAHKPITVDEIAEKAKIIPKY